MKKQSKAEYCKIKCEKYERGKTNNGNLYISKSASLYGEIDKLDELVYRFIAETH